MRWTGNRQWWIPILLVAAVFVAYWPAIRAREPVWDDEALLSNPITMAPDGLAKIWFQPGLNKAEAHYWPVTYTVAWLQHRLWGGNLAGFHAVNVGFHALNSVLFWLLLRSMALPGATLAAFIFALHPTRVESVAWISELKDVLSAALFLTAFLAFLRFAQKRGRVWYVLCFVAFVLAMLSKSVAVALPAVIVVWIYFSAERTKTKETIRAVVDWKPLLIWLVPLFIAGAAFAFLDARRSAGVDQFAREAWLPLFDRLLVIGRAFWFYPYKLIWPATLTAIYPSWSIDRGDALAYLYPLAAIGAVALAWGMRRRLGRGVFASLAIYAILFAPTSGVVPYGFQIFSYVADRFGYLATAGLIALGVSLAAGIARRTGLTPITIACASGSILLILGILTWRQAALYDNAGTLMADTLRHNPGSVSAHLQVGRYLYGQGRFAESIPHFEEAARAKPWANHRWQLGRAMEAAGRKADAKHWFGKSLEAYADYGPAHFDLGNILDDEGDIDAALMHYTAAVAAMPESADAHNCLGTALARKGRLSQAIRHFKLALQFQPDHADAAWNFKQAAGTLEKAKKR